MPAQRQVLMRAWPVLAQAELVVLGGAFFVNGNVNPAGMCGQASLACFCSHHIALVMHHRH